MSKVITAIDNFRTEDTTLFLVGGITDCPDWQSEAIASLSNLTLLNPRRKNFPIHDPNAAKEQIEWEYKALRYADAILFWFPHETLCPIVLYELGAWSMSNKPLFVGTHPLYQRKQDVIVQTRLVRPDIEIVFSLSDLFVQVHMWRSKEQA